MDAKGYTVGAVAGLTGLSVRTLHHYDQIDLLQPSERSAAGYRLYSPQDLQRPQRVLFYRELGFGLDTIAVIIDDPCSTDSDHLRLGSGQARPCVVKDSLYRLTPPARHAG
jgi:DNA-binding transcriptional MerR regulator